MNGIAYDQNIGQQLTGRRFRVNRYDCVWTVLRYARCGNWVCQEPDHGTTCQFHFSEIIEGDLVNE